MFGADRVSLEGWLVGLLGCKVEGLGLVEFVGLK